MHSYVHCSIIYNSQDMKQPQCPWKYEWIKKCDISILRMKHPHTVEYYILWVDLEAIV